jgi:alpha 1,3-glucosidase
VLSRSFFAGTQRYGAIWTGDNFARWDHYKISVPMLLSMSVVGLSFVGADVGGFFKHPEKDLITRWHQFGALAYPFYRSHAHLETPRREPWMYDKEVIEAVRSVEHTRYSLMPMWYTLFAEHAFNGAAIIRPIWYDFMGDASLYVDGAQDRELVVGKELLVVAAMDPAQEANVPVVLPGPSEWYDFWTGTKHPPGRIEVANSKDHVPMFVRAGSLLIQKARARRSTAAQKRDPYSFTVCVDAQGEARGRLYVDDFSTTAYTTGAYVYQEFSLKGGVLTSAALSLGRTGLPKPPAPNPAAKLDVGLAVERIDVHGTAATKATFTAPGAAPVEMATYKSGDVLTVKLPPIKVGEHGWKLELS